MSASLAQSRRTVGETKLGDAVEIDRPKILRKTLQILYVAPVAPLINYFPIMDAARRQR